MNLRIGWVQSNIETYEQIFSCKGFVFQFQDKCIIRGHFPTSYIRRTSSLLIKSMKSFNREEKKKQGENGC
jgi:hypothetical protein